MAGAHFTESATLFGQRRRNLAVTILELSRGWQMRNPVKIRAAEYRASMIGEDPVATDVITLEPGVLLAEGPRRPEMADMGLPTEMTDLLERATAASAVYSTLLDDEPVDMRDGHAAAERWAADFPRLALYMRREGTSVEQARLNARARFIADQRQDIANAASAERIGQEQFGTWLADALPAQLAKMPYSGRLAELLFIRLRNAEEKWERNDLNDMNFLCAAAGYADVVVGEKKTSNYLKRANPSVRKGAVVCSRLGEAIEALGL